MNNEQAEQINKLSDRTYQLLHEMKEVCRQLTSIAHKAVIQQAPAPPAQSAETPKGRRRMHANLSERSEGFGYPHDYPHLENEDCSALACQPAEPSTPEPEVRRRQWLVEECDVTEGELITVRNDALFLFRAPVKLVQEIEPIDEARLRELYEVFNNAFLAKGDSGEVLEQVDVACDIAGIAAVLKAVGLTAGRNTAGGEVDAKY